MKILFEDENLIVVVKDSGIASQGTTGNVPNLIDILEEERGGEFFCVHRLDLQTSGIITYAKNSDTAGKLTESLKSAEKKYIAVVHGETPVKGEMHDLLYHDKRINKSFIATKDRKGVKEAYLEYDRLGFDGEFSLVSVKLHTGRTHQIRVQFASRGFPLKGDGKYGSKVNTPLALHCYYLSFVHPKTKEKLTFTGFPSSTWNGFELN